MWLTRHTNLEAVAHYTYQFCAAVGSGNPALTTYYAVQAGIACARG